MNPRVIRSVTSELTARPSTVRQLVRKRTTRHWYIRS